MKIYTKTTVEPLIKQGQTAVIIGLYEADKAKNPLNAYQVEKLADGLSWHSKNLAMEQIHKGKNLGLDSDLLKVFANSIGMAVQRYNHYRTV